MDVLQAREAAAKEAKARAQKKGSAPAKAGAAKATQGVREPLKLGTVNMYFTGFFDFSNFSKNQFLVEDL